MENKQVGYLLLGISVVIIGIIFLFNVTLRDFANKNCLAIHGDPCPMYSSVETQTYLSLAIVAVLIIVSFFLIYSRQNEKIVVKKVKEKTIKKEIDTSSLKPEEKQVFKIVKENKAIFQADLIEKTQFGKAKITRILDRLEGQGLVERRRRGMTNVVVMKE